MHFFLNAGDFDITKISVGMVFSIVAGEEIVWDIIYYNIAKEKIAMRNFDKATELFRWIELRRL